MEHSQQVERWGCQRGPAAGEGSMSEAECGPGQPHGEFGLCPVLGTRWLVCKFKSFPLCSMMLWQVL